MMKLERAKRRGKRYLNPVPTSVGSLKTMLTLIPMYLSNKAETTPRERLGPFRTEPSVYERPPESGLRVTWFGHSSMLMEMDGVRLLIDPVWDERAGPGSAGFGWVGPKRFYAPTLALADLPELDAVLLSHDHFDHLGARTVRELAWARPELRWITTLGVGAELRGVGVGAGRLTEVDWTQSAVVTGAELGAELRITALPARHFSGRSAWNRFHTLWSSFVLAGTRHRVYYGADSGFWEGFEAIGREYGPFDLAMLEVGAFNELWKDIHLGPDGAVQAFEAMGGSGADGGGMLMPLHWGLFNLALHGWREPIERVTEVAEQRAIRLFSPAPGEPVEVVKGRQVKSDWWKPQR